MVNDLIVKDGGDLRIPLPGGLRTQKREFLDQVRTGLRDRQALGFAGTALAATRDHGAPPQGHLYIPTAKQLKKTPNSTKKPDLSSCRHSSEPVTGWFQSSLLAVKACPSPPKEEAFMNMDSQEPKEATAPIQRKATRNDGFSISMKFSANQIVVSGN
jgi:hypothetical protein